MKGCIGDAEKGSASKAEPFVVCLTNTVAANFTANVLLAIGAKPAMIEEPSEAAELAAVADAVLINVGTVTPAQAAAMRAAIAACHVDADSRPRQKEISAIPWVLDPVACHVLAFRRALVREFLAAGPSIVRGNHGEIDYIRDHFPDLAESITLLSTGPVDRIWKGGDRPQMTGGDRPRMEIAGGVSMLQSVTATGCAQGAICAAFLGRGQSPFEACVSASRLMKEAGERAYGRAKTPGSFQIALLDELNRIACSAI